MNNNSRIFEVIDNLNGLLNTRGAGDELAEELGDMLAERVGTRVNLDKVTKRDASILMVAFGADDLAVSQHANKVARRMRSNRFAHGSWGATI